MILIYAKKSPFQHSVAPNVFPFTPVGQIATAKDLSNAVETVELRKQRVHAPLLLAENLGWSECNKQRSAFNIETYCTIVSVVKCRKIFRVYNNINNYEFLRNHTKNLRIHSEYYFLLLQLGDWVFF